MNIEAEKGQDEDLAEESGEEAGEEPANVDTRIQRRELQPGWRYEHENKVWTLKVVSVFADQLPKLCVFICYGTKSKLGKKPFNEFQSMILI